MKLTGTIYYDGSAFAKLHDPLLARAVWAAIQLADDPTLAAVVYGHAPQPETRTSVTAERIAYTVASVPPRLDATSRGTASPPWRAAYY